MLDPSLGQFLTIFCIFLLDFFCFFMWSTGLEAKDASSLLSPYPQRSPRGTAIQIDQQASLYSLCSDTLLPFPHPHHFRSVV